MRREAPAPDYSLTRVSWREWVALGSGLVAVGALFLPWTNLTATRQDVEDALNSLPSSEVARDAFTTGFLAWSGPVVLALAGLAVVLLGQRPALRRGGLPHLWLIAVAVALVLMLLAWLGMSWQFSADVRDFLSQEGGIGFYGGFGRYLATVCGVVSVAAAVLDLRATRRR